MDRIEEINPIKTETDKLSEFDKFTEFTKKLLAVPNSEIQTKTIKVVKHKPTKA